MASTIDINRLHHFVRIVNWETQNKEIGWPTPDTFMIQPKDKGCLSGYFREYWGDNDISEFDLVANIVQTAGRPLNPKYKLPVVSLDIFMTSIEDDNNLPADIVSFELTSGKINVSHMCINIWDLNYANTIAGYLYTSVVAVYDLPSNVT